MQNYMTRQEDTTSIVHAYISLFGINGYLLPITLDVVCLVDSCCSVVTTVLELDGFVLVGKIGLSTIRFCES